MDDQLIKWLLGDLDNGSTFCMDHSYVSYINGVTEFQFTGCIWLNPHLYDVIFATRTAINSCNLETTGTYP